MLHLIATAILTFAPVHAADAAEPVLLAPYSASLCSALFLQKPSAKTEQGPLRLHLNGMNADIFYHLEQLDNKTLTGTDRARKFLWSMRPSQVIKGLFKDRRDEKDPTAATDVAVRAVFRNLASNEWKADTEPTIAAILGRVRQLDEDFSSERATDVSFGYEVRGQAQITAYLDQIAHHARALDAAINPTVDQQHPHFKTSKVVSRLAAVGIVTSYSGYFLWPLLKQSLDEDLAGQIMLAGFMAYIGPQLYASLQKSARFAWSGVSESTRIRFENEYASHRTQEAMQMIEEMKTMSAEAPSGDSFVYNSLNSLVPRSFATALSDAQSADVDVDTNELADVILRQRRGLRQSLDGNNIAADVKDPLVRLMSDQFLFFDQDTGEPVLASFLRLKKPKITQTKRRKKKVQEEAKPIFAPEGALGAR